ncbi:hypothetical protein SARC_02879 [Sphaeroforma arctica JP610]|uniref:Uncharacterized protein n=1 Tax=Sphaeroforma arctica JP610 TaxID=667725 RepID=A0A0L0G7E3_9EUKA|nr:hypothetical protein SARC_02879 [Sphaeroforma arctica JP610]KNC84925.1 hypothetical protein SARC_02879 [Sphaeroforma arctica JP610]|eukprot:XP_014158827.1 hypothetical protein SARC_02879 [Sphaeroforma arctica JP610]
MDVDDCVVISSDDEIKDSREVNNLTGVAYPSACAILVPTTVECISLISSDDETQAPRLRKPRGTKGKRNRTPISINSQSSEENVDLPDQKPSLTPTLAKPARIPSLRKDHENGKGKRTASYATMAAGASKCTEQATQLQPHTNTKHSTQMPALAPITRKVSAEKRRRNGGAVRARGMGHKGQVRASAKDCIDLESVEVSSRLVGSSRTQTGETSGETKSGRYTKKSGISSESEVPKVPHGGKKLDTNAPGHIKVRTMHRAVKGQSEGSPVTKRRKNTIAGTLAEREVRVCGRKHRRLQTPEIGVAKDGRLTEEPSDSGAFSDSFTASPLWGSPIGDPYFAMEMR